MDKLKTAIFSSATSPAKETEPGTFVKSYVFLPDFIGFSGHFPGYPVLPAFMQVLTVLAMTEEVRGHTIRLVSIIKAKFRSEIHPGQEEEVRCRERIIKGATGIEATLTVADGPAASLLLAFADKDDKE
jgi:3-hydroxyacyl-[acyl-carrier-protein] dehydratase